MNLSVSADAKQLVAEIIAKYDLNPIISIKYETGSAAGDGYASRPLAVSIENSQGTLELFLKCGLIMEAHEALPTDKAYANETYFYDVVYPAYRNFLKDRGHQHGFRNAPKCYGTLNQNIIAMENLKKKGYSLFERTGIMDDEHIELVIKTFAKFHAISFAFKDQDRENYDKFAENAFDMMSTKNEGNGIIKVIGGAVKHFLKKLDPVVDREILDKCDLEDLVAALSSADRTLNEYSILTQGDCWCNNIMFLYENVDSKKPIDVMLIDWQLLRPASPVFDLSLFYLTVASEEKLAKTENYLKLYHQEVSQQIRQLDSDPEILYPFEVFLKEWGRHCKYGFSMATMLLKNMLLKEDEVFDLEQLDFDDTEALENLFPKFDNEEEFLKRMKNMAKYMINNGYL